jgi:hypothetical protein
MLSRKTEPGKQNQSEETGKSDHACRNSALFQGIENVNVCLEDLVQLWNLSLKNVYYFRG